MGARALLPAGDRTIRLAHRARLSLRRYPFRHPTLLRLRQRRNQPCGIADLPIATHPVTPVDERLKIERDVGIADAEGNAECGEAF